LCPAASDIAALGRGQSLIFTRVAIQDVKQQKIKKAYEAGGGEAPSPAKVQKQKADERTPMADENFAAASVIAVASPLSASGNQ